MKHIFVSPSPVIALIAAVSFALPTNTSAALSCTVIPVDLGSGSSDSLSSQAVLSLQRFLAASGYLSATPNGYFGPATLAGVRMFQASRGISATGFVGPLTRGAIQKESCSTETTSSPVPSTSIFSAPKSGESLALGASYRISWNAPSRGNYSLILDNASGTARGIISYYAPDSGRQTWDVGSVSVSGSDQKEFVEPGTYRLRLQERSVGPTGSDQKSAFFEIAALPAVVKSFMPSSVSADGRSALVIYGSGFTEGTSAYVHDSYKKWLNVLYASADGTVLVLAVPAEVSVGTHSLILKDRYGVSSVGPTIVVKKP